MTKCSDISLILVNLSKFANIFQKFPDHSLTRRKCFSPTHGKPVHALFILGEKTRLFLRNHTKVKDCEKQYLHLPKTTGSLIVKSQGSDLY